LEKNYDGMFAAGATSRLGVKGTRDLEGGTQAHFQIELQIVPDTPKGGVVSTSANRGTFVGLQNKDAGTVRLGTQETMAYETFAFDANGRVEYKPQLWRLTTTAADSLGQQDRAGNSVKYITPDISGFTGHVLYGLGESTSYATKGTYSSYGVKFHKDNLKINVFKDKIGNAQGTAYLPGTVGTDGVSKDGGTTGTAMIWGGSTTTAVYRNIAAATYDFGPAVVNYIYAKAYTTTNVGNITTSTVGVKVPMDKFTFALSYGTGTIDSYTTSSSSIAKDMSLTDTTFGATYAFDKSTSAYFLGSQTTTSTGYVQGGSVKTASLGLQYKF